MFLPRHLPTAHRDPQNLIIFNHSLSKPIPLVLHQRVRGKSGLPSPQTNSFHALRCAHPCCSSPASLAGEAQHQSSHEVWFLESQNSQLLHRSLQQKNRQQIYPKTIFENSLFPQELSLPSSLVFIFLFLTLKRTSIIIKARKRKRCSFISFQQLPISSPVCRTITSQRARRDSCTNLHFNILARISLPAPCGELIFYCVNAWACNGILLNMVV